MRILNDKLPIVAIVGRPNVGKSTLFNRVVGRRKAVVLDIPGMTRDRNYETAAWAGRNFSLVDTGGYESVHADVIYKQMREQSMVAVHEADIVVFLTSVLEPDNPVDQDVANELRRSRKPVLLAVNKCDNTRRHQEAMQFYSLGFEELFPISSINGGGVADLLDRIVELIPEAPPEAPRLDSIRIAVIGKPNVGKSSLVNAILGQKRVIVSDVPGTTRDTIDTVFSIAVDEPARIQEEPQPDLDAFEKPEPEGEEDYESEFDEFESDESDELDDSDEDFDSDWSDEVAEIEELDELEELDEGVALPLFPGAPHERRYTLIDTAGLRRRGKIERGIEMLSAQANLERCDVALVLIDAEQGITEQDKHVAGYAFQSHRACIIVVNKWDLLAKDNSTAGEFARRVRNEMGYLQHVPMIMVSAKTGQRVHRILPIVDRVFQEYTRQIKTSVLNKWLRETIIRLSPPFHKGRQLRIKYVTQVARRPPTFAFFVNDPRIIHFSYERYLRNRMREAFGFEGVPVKFFFRKKSSRRRFEGEIDI
jgi:GTP-binding protein